MRPSIDPISHPICFQRAERVVPSAWNEHLPFAMYLVSVVRPRVLVELGTYSGASYCAFLQAVQSLGVATRCFAVDHWEGDPQSGFYGSDVLADLRRYHDRYTSFSTLVPKAFDDAVAHFDGGSIDVLHIDGYHTYEAVKHDFEAWRPKLSARGIVLLHDTAVRDGDYGVFRLWQELTREFPTLEFTHGHGLGMALVGAEPFEPAIELCEIPEDELHSFRSLFAALGRIAALEVERRALAEHASSLTTQVTQVQESLADRAEECEAANERAVAAGHSLSEAESRIDELVAALAAGESRIDELVAALAAGESRIDELAAEISAAQRASAVSAQRLDEAQRREAEGIDTLASVLDSESYRVGRALLAPAAALKRALARREGSDVWPDSQGHPAEATPESATPPLSRRFARWGRRATSQQRGPGSPRSPVVAHDGNGIAGPSDAGAIPRPSLTVVVPVWNALEYMEQCLQSIYETQTALSFEVVVVDNGSADAVGEWLRSQQASRPGLRVIRFPENVGFAAGINAGARAARGKYLALLNSDTVVTDGWADILVDALETDSSLGLVSPVTNYVGEGPQIDPDSVGIGAEEARVYARSVATRRSVIRVPERVAFFCVLMRRTLFERLNGLDEGFGIGNFEDEDFCLRTQLLGLTIGIVEASFVFHHGSKTFADNLVEHGAWMERNARRYLDKLQEIASSPPGDVPGVRARGSVDRCSVIVRTRNRPESLALALNSLAWQTADGFEVVVVNDGGDDVANVLAGYEQFFPVRYRWNREARGQAGALNDGLTEATGTYIAYLDDDDLVYPFHLASLCFAFEQNSGTDFVYSWFNRALVKGRGEDTAVVARIRSAPWRFALSDLLVRNHPAMHTWMHSADLVERIGGFDEEFQILQDWDFLLRAAKHTAPMSVPRDTCEYRIYADLSNSVSEGRRRAIAEVELVYARHPSDDVMVERLRAAELEALSKQATYLARLQRGRDEGTVGDAAVANAFLQHVFGFPADALTDALAQDPSPLAPIGRG